MNQFCSDPNWDGGGLWFGFAGHGRVGDGALVFDDGSTVTAKHFVMSCSELARHVTGEGRLRLSIMLDSCYSGAFALDVLDRLWRYHRNELVPFHIMAATLPDEQAWELPDLGHGLATFCWSVRSNSLGSVGAEAVGPENTFIPTLSLAQAPYGVPLLTAGRQHTLEHFNGTGYVTILQNDVPLIENGRLRSRHEIDSDVYAIRSESAELFRQYRALTGLSVRAS